MSGNALCCTKMTIEDFRPWVEKYRPANLSQISGQTETVAVLSKSIQSQNVSLLNDEKDDVHYIVFT
jgi:hypothetical protein